MCNPFHKKKTFYVKQHFKESSEQKINTGKPTESIISANGKWMWKTPYSNFMTRQVPNRFNQN